MPGAKGIEAGKAYVLVELRENIDRGIAQLRNRMKLVSKELVANGKAIAGVGIAATGVFAGLAKALSAPIRVAANIQKTTAEFTALTRSAQQARAVIANLRMFAARTPLQFEGLAQETRTLLAFGIGTRKAVEDIMRLSEVSGGNQERLQRLALAFGQVAAKGRLFATEVRQFTENGFNPLQTIAATTGKSMGELLDLMEDGQITFQDVRQAFVDVTSSGGRFFGLLRKQSQSLIGLWTTLKDSVKIAIEPLGQELIPLLSDLTRQAIAAANVAGKFFKENRALAMSFLGITVAGLAAGAALVGLGVPLILIGKTMEAFDQVVLKSTRNLIALMRVGGTSAKAQGVVTVKNEVDAMSNSISVSTQQTRLDLTALGKAFTNAARTAIVSFRKIATSVTANTSRVTASLTKQIALIETYQQRLYKLQADMVLAPAAGKASAKGASKARSAKAAADATKSAASREGVTVAQVAAGAFAGELSADLFSMFSKHEKEFKERGKELATALGMEVPKEAPVFNSLDQLVAKGEENVRKARKGITGELNALEAMILRGTSTGKPPDLFEGIDDAKTFKSLDTMVDASLNKGQHSRNPATRKYAASLLAGARRDIEKEARRANPMQAVLEALDLAGPGAELTLARENSKRKIAPHIASLMEEIQRESRKAKMDTAKRSSGKGGLLSGMLGGVRTGASGVSRVLAGLRARVAALLGPFLGTAAIVATVAAGFLYLANRAGVLRDVINNLAGPLKKFMDTATETFGGISDAISLGEFTRAIKILWAGIKTAFFEGAATIVENLPAIFEKGLAYSYAIIESFAATIVDIVLAIPKLIYAGFVGGKSIANILGDIITGNFKNGEIQKLAGGARKELDSLLEANSTDIELRRKREEARLQEQEEKQNQGVGSIADSPDAAVGGDRPGSAMSEATREARERNAELRDEIIELRRGKTTLIRFKDSLSGVHPAITATTLRLTRMKKALEATKEAKERIQELKNERLEVQIGADALKRLTLARQGANRAVLEQLRIEQQRTKFMSLRSDLQNEIRTLVMGEAAAERHRLAMEGLSKAQIDQIQALQQMKNRLKETSEFAKQLNQEFKSPLKVFQDQQKKIRQAQLAGLISQKVAAEANTAAIKKLREESEKLNQRDPLNAAVTREQQIEAFRKATEFQQQLADQQKGRRIAAATARQRAAAARKNGGVSEHDRVMRTIAAQTRDGVNMVVRKIGNGGEVAII